MIFDNIIHGQSCNNTLLSCMRKVLLTHESSPLNTFLFYNQFFNLNNLSKQSVQNIFNCITAWELASDRVIVFVDMGINEKTLGVLQQYETEYSHQKIEFRMLADNIPKEVSDILDSNYSLLEKCAKINNFLPNDEITKEIAEIMSANEAVYPKHLPEKFNTYYQEHEAQAGQEIPIRCIVESPFAGDIDRNIEYAAEAISFLVLGGKYAPMASHLLYTRMLDDDDKDERMLGIDAGLNYGAKAEETIVFVDRGLSTGMKYGIINAEKAGRKYSFATLSKDPDIVKQVSKITTLEELEQWCELMKIENEEIFKKNGFLVDLNFDKKKSIIAESQKIEFV